MKFNGNILKKLRQESGLKRREWLKIIQIPPSTLHLYENNIRTPNSTNMLKICNNLKKPLEFFYDDCICMNTNINNKKTISQNEKGETLQ